MRRLRALLLASYCLAPFVAPAHAQDVGEMLLRIDRLENDNRRLNGQVEQLGNQLRRQEDAFKRFQQDVEFRFKEGGGKSAGAAPPAAPAPARRSDAYEPPASGAPKTIGQLAAEASGGPAPLNPGALPPKGEAPAASGTAKGDYETARAILDRGDYEAAEMAFRNFLRTHGKDRLKPEGLFGLGESFYRRNRYREAAEQYLSITTEHAKASRAAEAMLKLGMSLRGLGATVEACGAYSEVAKKYPNASQQVKQAVDREKKRAQCAA